MPPPPTAKPFRSTLASPGGIGGTETEPTGGLRAQAAIVAIPNSAAIRSNRSGLRLIDIAIGRSTTIIVGYVRDLALPFAAIRAPCELSSVLFIREIDSR